MFLSTDQIKALNDGTSLVELYKKQHFRFGKNYQDVIDLLRIMNNLFPTPEEIKVYLNTTNKEAE